MLTVTSWTSLVLLTVAVSQPLFYWLALGRASGALSAGAYIELRQRINAAIAQRLTRLYVATLLSLLALLASAIAAAAWLVVASAAVALVALVADAVLATRLNVPINTLMDGWSVADVPPDWQRHRAAWERAFTIRRVVLLTGFGALTLGLSVRA
jgi:hypothetical protein